MKKIMNWMLAAILICGATVFTSCSDSEDNPSQEQAKKNRTEFIKHTRENLKDIAENLNFHSWEVANEINQEFNTTVLNNPQFEKAIIPLFTQKVRESIQPVEEGSELAAMGYKQYATIDLTKFNYRFTMKEDGSGFDVEEADDFEMIINGFNPRSQEQEKGVRKLTLKASGDTYKLLDKRFGNEQLAVVILVPSDFEFSISSMVPGSWKDAFKGAFKNNVKMSGESEFMNLLTDAISITGVLSSGIEDIPHGKYGADATDLYFSTASDPVANESSMNFSFGHNNKSMIELEATSKYTDKEIAFTDFSQFTTSGSILNVLIALVSGGSFEGFLTLNDDLTTAISISDCGKAMQLQKEMAHARRNYADQATIEGYTQQLNELVSAKLNCKDLSQEIPMKLQTAKFGVDYWAMPAFNFADEKGFVPITELLDKESIEYGINIIDHAAEPMAGAIVTIRQLLQFVQTFVMQSRVNQAQVLAANE
jgi:hypothetical protein